MPLLDRVGFCGVDDSVNLQELVDLSKAHPWIEWGVLLRPDRQGQPRYASQSLLRRLGQLAGAPGNRESGGQDAECLNSLDNEGDDKARSRSPRARSGVCNAGEPLMLAAHLCGEDCLQALHGNTAHVTRWHKLLGFRRVQINPTVANNAGGWEPGVAVESLRKVAAALPGVEFILQVNDETRELARRLFEDPDNGAPGNFAALLDPSCGLGIVPNAREPPFKGVHCGYAGGIGPNTVVAQLQEVEAACKGHEGSVWIDMESGIRTVDTSIGSDIFDLTKVRSVLEAVVLAEVIQ